MLLSLLLVASCFLQVLRLPREDALWLLLPRAAGEVGRVAACGAAQAPVPVEGLEAILRGKSIKIPTDIGIYMYSVNTIMVYAIMYEAYVCPCPCGLHMHTHIQC